MMNTQKKRMFIIKIAYWLGIGADAFWAVALLFPNIFGKVFRTVDYEYVVGTASAADGRIGLGRSMLSFFSLVV